MKKRFTLILASMLLTMGAWAQTVVTTINTERAYTLECRSGYAHSAARFIGVTDAGVINGQASTAVYITFENGTEAGSYYIKVGEKYINCDGTNLSASTEKTTAWVLGTVDQTVTFKYPNTTMYLNNNGTTCTDGTITSLKANNHPSGPTSSNACSTWQMCEYDLNNSVEVTYNYMFNGVQRKSATVTQMVGAAYEAPAIDYVTLAYPDGSVTKETTTVEVTCTQNLPFTVSTDYANATWYYMTIRSNNQEYVARSENAPYTNSKTVTAGDNGLWAFKGNVFDGIQVINKGAGDGYTLGYAGTTTGANVSMAEGETTWTIEEGNGGFILGQGGNAYAHDYHYDKLQIWNDAAAATDAGSAFNVFTVEELTNTQKTALQTLIDQADTYKAGTTVGYYTEASVANLATPLENANTALSSNSLEEVLNATTALQAAINNLELILPEKGKFYRFKHPTADAYMLSDVYSGDAKYLAMGALESNKVSSVFYYGEDGTLLSYANGRYLSDAGQSSSDWTCLAVGTKGNAATFGKGSAVGRVGFYVGSASNRAYYSGNANDGYVNAGGSFGSNAGYDWVVEEVTYLPVAMNTTYGYATLCSPVALSTYQWNSTSAYRVKAYTGTLSDNVLTLTRIDEADGVIPANTPVVLEYVADIENGYVYLAVSNSDKEAIASDLIGTAAAVVNPKAGTEYTLQGHNGGVAFKQYTGDNLTGFKAYLVVESQAQAIRIRKGSEEGTTSIENAQLTMDNENVVIYDLQGRRVEKMEKGIYIVNGKKIIK